MGRIVSSKTEISPNPQSLRPYLEIGSVQRYNQAKMRSLGVALIQYDWYPSYRGNLDTHAEREVTHCVRMKAEIRMMHLQAKECQKLAAHHWRLGERYGTDSFLQPLEGASSVENLDFGLL